MARTLWYPHTLKKQDCFKYTLFLCKYILIVQ